MARNALKAREFSRLDRLNATVRKVLAEPVSVMARASLNGLASITEVELTPDLRRGTVYLSVYGGNGDKREWLRQVNARAGSLQAALAQALRTKRVPVLTFKLDDSLERGSRIQDLLRPAGDDGAAP